MISIGAANAQKKAIISAKETTHNFGEIVEKTGKVTHTFEIVNKGDGPLVITRVIASCGCTTPEWTKEPVAPKGKAKVNITYDPAGRPGPFTKSISVYSNGKEGSFRLSIKGDVVEKKSEPQKEK
jgi:hypothetical protein